MRTGIIPDSRYAGHLIHPASPSKLGNDQCIGREKELELIRIALGLYGKDNKWLDFGFGGPFKPGCRRIRLEGPSGRGKRSLVAEVSRRVGLPLYEIAGHADMSPEDLVIAIVPRPSGATAQAPPLALQASPLTTAFLWGGVAYFDGLHVAPEKALSPLISLLDGRMELYSGLTGLLLTPRPDAAPFYLFCSWDPSGSYALPAFIEQRTAPRLTVGQLAVGHTKSLLGTLAPVDKNQLFETAKEQKQLLLSSELSDAVRALKETMWAVLVARAVQYAEEEQFHEALGRLTAIGNLLPEKRALIEELRGRVAVALRGRAHSLAIRSDRNSAAKATPMYKALLGAGYCERHDRNDLAHCLLHEGNLDEALSEILKAKEEPSAPAVVWITCGEIFEAKNNIPEAIKCYQQAAELPPELCTGGSTTQKIAKKFMAKLAGLKHTTKRRQPWRRAQTKKRPR
jgi:hypothetical protein